VSTNYIFVSYTLKKKIAGEIFMNLHKEHDEQLFSDHKYDDEINNLALRKKVKRVLEDKLERKRLQEEFKDDFDELSADFNWDELDK
jgi:hypothetical protein